MPTRPAAAALAASLLLAGCGSGGDAGGEAPSAERAATPAASAGPATATPTQTPAPAREWNLVASGEGTALRFPARGAHAMLLFCPAGEDRLLVNVPAFNPIGSEERFTFGSDAEAHALVADTRGDPQRGGVSGEGAVPASLAALIAGPLAAVYGAQQSGPHPAVPAELARGFVEGCRDSAPDM